jgi:hypothetical protein
MLAIVYHLCNMPRTPTSSGSNPCADVKNETIISGIKTFYIEVVVARRRAG